MSKKEEILHKLSTEDRNYIKEKFKEKDVKIAELELKLAECEQEKLLNSYGMDRNADIAEDYKQQIADLEAKLAESESKARTYAKEIVFLDKQLKEKEKEETKRMEGFEKRCQEYYNSDEYKKDFAIAELEKVKKEFNGAFSISIQQEMFDKYIDQQIKSLKGDADE